LYAAAAGTSSRPAIGVRGGARTTTTTAGRGGTDRAVEVDETPPSVDGVTITSHPGSNGSQAMNGEGPHSEVRGGGAYESDNSGEGGGDLFDENDVDEEYD